MSVAAFLAIALLVSSPEARPEVKDIDTFVRKAMDRIEVVPGLSVAVVQGPDVDLCRRLREPCDGPHRHR
jgi:hypothetical protein